jgi:hypothetical protein
MAPKAQILTIIHSTTKKTDPSGNSELQQAVEEYNNACKSINEMTTSEELLAWVQKNHLGTTARTMPAYGAKKAAVRVI